jgi:hypothetical protein
MQPESSWASGLRTVALAKSEAAKEGMVFYDDGSCVCSDCMRKIEQAKKGSQFKPDKEKAAALVRKIWLQR